MWTVIEVKNLSVHTILLYEYSNAAVACNARVNSKITFEKSRLVQVLSDTWNPPHVQQKRSRAVQPGHRKYEGKAYFDNCSKINLIEEKVKCNEIFLLG